MKDKITYGLIGTALALSPLVVIGYTQSYNGNVGEATYDAFHDVSQANFNDALHDVDRMTLGCRSPKGRHAHVVRDQVIRNRNDRREFWSDLHEIEEFRFALGAGLALLVVGGITVFRRK